MEQKVSKLKNRTYEEIHGPEKAALLKKDRSEKLKGNKNLEGKYFNPTGAKWYTNGTSDKMYFPGEEIPHGWIPGRTKNRKYRTELVQF